MRKFFLDTTVLTDLLLKHGPRVERIKALLKEAETELPAFAIREMKAGPLRSFVWTHNKLATTHSLAKTLEALHALSRTPQRYMTSTAIEALSVAQSKGIGPQAIGSLTKKHGTSITLDWVQAYELRLHLRRLITQAWRNRRNVATRVVRPLACYQETAPTEKRGLLGLKPNKCLPLGECCLAEDLRKGASEIEKLIEANNTLPVTGESQRRGKALRDLGKPTFKLDDKACRDLGDALFAFFAPKDAAILTTNLKDHRPLAAALGKQAVAPPEEAGQ
jgi:hypothetical protein